VSQPVELFLTFLVILNPLGALLVWNTLMTPERSAESRFLALLPGGIALTGLAVAVALGDELLDVLDLSASSLQVAAGLLLVLGTLHLFLQADPFRPPVAGGLYLSIIRMALWLATPAALAAAAFYGADRGVSDALAGIIPAVAIATLALVMATDIESRVDRIWLRELGRVTGAGILVIAVDLIIDGVTSV
jgi:small neutral amino acid transporter SnatA (MarC family)